MTAKEKAELMMNWFNEIHIDEEKDIEYKFTHLSLGEKKMILNKSMDEVCRSHHNLYGVNNKAVKFYLEVKQEIEKL